MAQFQEAFPEVKAMAPVLAGHSPPPKSILNGLRRQQLADLAFAYGLEEQMNRDGTKEEMLPFLRAAEARGDFTKLAKRPWYLAKARLTADEVQMLKAKGIAPYPSGDDLPDREEKKVHAPDSYAGMQQRASQLGIKAMGLTKEALREILDEATTKPAA